MVESQDPLPASTTPSVVLVSLGTTDVADAALWFPHFRTIAMSRTSKESMLDYAEMCIEKHD